MRTHLKQSILTIFFVSSAFTQSNDALFQKSAPTRNFKYVKGEKEWTEHIPTKITSTFEELVDNNVFIKRLVCLGDSADLGKTPFHRIDPVCMQGHGAKMVVPLGYPTWSYEVILTPPTGGLFEQKHMTERIPLQFYDSSAKFKTKFFLLPFDDYEIPVYSLKEPQTFLPMWKHFFMVENNMDKSFFDSHVRVIGAYVRDMHQDSINCKYFNVFYVFHVDWAKIELQDGFLISDDFHNLADNMDSLDFEKYFQVFQEKLPEGFMQHVRKNITKLNLINNVVSKDEVINTVNNASQLLGFDVNKDIRLSSRGELTLEVWGTIDEKANKCLHAIVSLEDGKISEVSETACYVN